LGRFRKIKELEVVGRKQERHEMEAMLKDKDSHFLAIVGRRRVGKTFLIREVYKQHIVFEMTGLKDADLSAQLTNFNLQHKRYFQGNTNNNSPENWLLAFNSLSIALESNQSAEKPVVFFDELPWIAGKRSGFLEALGHWWNNWASQQNIVVVVCGSAASWMIQKVVNAKGGLHNRISKLIKLEPFTLAETKEYLSSKRIEYSPYQTIQLYMAIGGIPFYLKQLKRGLSAAQNIQELCFNKNSILLNEFENLYPALFSNAQQHIEVIQSLAKKQSGLSRSEILESINMKDGGGFTQVLNELEASGFIASFSSYSKKKKDVIFRLTDEYSLFYLKFISGNKRFNENHWLQISQKQEYLIWCGYAFENICFKHVDQIKKALGISGVYSTQASLYHKANSLYNKGFQVDLLIDRKDGIVNLCEMKFSNDDFVITNDYAEKLRNKVNGVRAITKGKKTVQTTFITTYGLMQNANSIDFVDHDLKAEILFD
jgi:AAA+ ATPase superfamily predicted ATPase